MRPVYRLKEEKEITPELMEELNKEVESIIEDFAKYLESFKGKGYSKHSVMGPIGKLLSAITSNKLETKDALVGYVINVHKNTMEYDPSIEASESLKKGIERLLNLKKTAPNRLFTKATREIDYGVYKKKLEYILSKSEKKSIEKGGE